MNERLEALFTQAYQLQSDNQLQQARQIYQKILKDEPNHSETLHYLGLTEAQLGDMDAAIQYLLRAHTAAPENPVILNNLANAYKKTQQLKEAIHAYERALEYDPQYAQAHNNLATIYALQNANQNALEHYVKAVNIAPDFSAAHFNLGLLLLRMHELKAAKTQFTNVIELNPGHIEAQFYLGVLNLNDALFDEAKHCFLAILEHDSEHVEALTNLGVIALKTDQKQVAVDYFTKALAFDNDHVEARNNLAATFMHYDRFENALMHYDVLLKNDSSNVEYLYNSGVAQMALGHLNEAIVLFERLLKIQKNHAHALNNMAVIYIKMGQRETAQEYLKQALAVNPDDTISSHMLNAITGSDGKTTPEYAKNLFDNYALNYEQHMKEQLHYSIPQHINRIIHHLGLERLDNTLDLGCGTGLTGIPLREISKHLTGVDISEKMIAQAKEKAIYDTLIQKELTDFFKHNNKAYDLIVAADVFPYFSDLSGLFSSITHHMTPNGYFIFTTEISSTSPWFLEASARFSHHPGYIQELAQQNSLQIIQKEKIPGRIQNEMPLDIMIYVLKQHKRSQGM